MRARFLSPFTAIALTSLALAGCSNEPARHETGGKVTVGGKPVACGTITFENEATGTTDTGQIEDGRYEVKNYKTTGLTPGRYKVTIIPRVPGGNPNEVHLAVPGKKTAPVVADGPKIPEKYAQSATSGLTADVKAGDNPPFDFDLK